MAVKAVKAENWSDVDDGRLTTTSLLGSMIIFAGKETFCKSHRVTGLGRTKHFSLILQQEGLEKSVVEDFSAGQVPVTFHSHFPDRLRIRQGVYQLNH